MSRETRTAVYDDELRVEAYRFDGFARPFPNHFHDYYVIGLVEDGERMLSCQNRAYAIHSGHILLFNPGDSHACVQSDGGALCYRGLNIAREVMGGLAREAAGVASPPAFSPNVILDAEAARLLRPLHEQMMRGARTPERRERLLRLIARLVRAYGLPPEARDPSRRDGIDRACAFMERHYAERVSLADIARRARMSESTLLRAFAREKGVTPYGYLENIRIGKARELLARGVSPVEAALQTGFSDQSHFTHAWSRFIGLAPGAYRDIHRRGHP